jgi:hypothetical protein
VEEDDPRLLQSALESGHDRRDGLTLSGFEIRHGPEGNAALRGEIGLLQAEECSGGLRLSWGDCHVLL